VFLQEIKRDFVQALRNLTSEYGFIDIILGDSQTTRHVSDSGNLARNLAQSIKERINDADAFLQIYPRLDKNKEEEKGWMTYELGLAINRGIPLEFCLDKKYKASP